MNRTLPGKTLPGKLIVISGPSGAGKGTIIKRLFELMPGRLVLSVSATTRKPRPGERDGVDYHFIDKDTFQRHRENGEFIECFQVQRQGHWYGTLESEVMPSLEQGKWVILEVDVQGTQAIKQRFPEAVTIFVMPPTLADLERRLRERGSEPEAEIQSRLEVARREILEKQQYDVQIVNDDLPRAVSEIRQFLEQTE